ncbi:phage tail protein [Dickeya chrysanthemi]|uniref:phage tail-collar fiber domain-containing protein n=1 Tax=Dickeya chrysanthemi TaxID=556 RepID=UPI00039E8FA6|nr:phage tail protein [Dickeya chrysanthemi]
MTTKYFALLTAKGAALLANATALGRQLQITQMALGDGGGALPTPDPAQTRLTNERRRAPLNSLSVDPANTNQIIAEQVIPEDEGGWWIREIGLYDAAGNLIAVANCPETYKPQLQEGSGRVQTVRMILIVSSTDAVTLKIDPSVVLATRAYTDAKAAETKAYIDDRAENTKGDAKNYTDAKTGSVEIEVKAHADNLMMMHVSAANPHPQYAPIASPSFIRGISVVADGASALLMRNETVKDIGLMMQSQSGAPLLQLLYQLSSHSVQMRNAAANSALVMYDSGDISIAPPAGHATYVSSHLILNAPAGGDNSDSAITSAWFGAELAGIPLPWPGAIAPTGWLKCNGQPFDRNRYPRLAQLYPSGMLPDLRGEFIRGWDDGRGVDSGRGILTAQSQSIQPFNVGIRYSITRITGGDTPINAVDGNGVNTAYTTTFPGDETRPRNIAFNYIVRAA